MAPQPEIGARHERPRLEGHVRQHRVQHGLFAAVTADADTYDGGPPLDLEH